VEEPLLPELTTVLLPEEELLPGLVITTLPPEEELPDVLPAEEFPV
jgi:hypothetical protein